MLLTRSITYSLHIILQEVLHTDYTLYSIDYDTSNSLHYKVYYKHILLQGVLHTDHIVIATGLRPKYPTEVSIISFYFMSRMVTFHFWVKLCIMVA